jgi:hypothetical protein
MGKFYQKKIWSREPQSCGHEKNPLRAGKQPSKQKSARSCIHKIDKKAAV